MFWIVNFTVKWVLNNIFTTWEKSPSHLERSGDLVPPNGDWFFIYLFCSCFLPAPDGTQKMLEVRAGHCSRFLGLLPRLCLAWRRQEARGGSPQLPRLETGVKAARRCVPFLKPSLGWLLSRALRGWFGGRGVLLVDAGKALLFRWRCQWYMT